MHWSYFAKLVSITISCILLLTSCSFQPLYTDITDTSYVTDNVIYSYDNKYSVTVNNITSSGLSSSILSKVNSTRNQESFSYFLYNFRHDLFKHLSLLAWAQLQHPHGSSGGGDVKTVASGTTREVDVMPHSRTSRYEVNITYAIDKEFTEIGENYSAKSNRIAYLIEYVIYKNGEEVYRNKSRHTNSVAISPSSYGYLLSLENSDKSMASFIAESVARQIIIFINADSSKL